MHPTHLSMRHTEGCQPYRAQSIEALHFPTPSTPSPDSQCHKGREEQGLQESPPLCKGIGSGTICLSLDPLPLCPGFLPHVLPVFPAKQEGQTC